MQELQRPCRYQAQSCHGFRYEFLPLQLEILSRNPMFVLLQILNQNIHQIHKKSTRSNPKCSERNMNHVDIRLMGL